MQARFNGYLETHQKYQKRQFQGVVGLVSNLSKEIINPTNQPANSTYPSHPTGILSFAPFLGGFYATILETARMMRFQTLSLST
jgi:hypothetical protein